MGKLAKVDLASLQSKKYQALVVRAKLKKCLSKWQTRPRNYKSRNLGALLIGILWVSHRRMDNIRLPSKPFVRNFSSTSRSFSLGSPDWALLSSMPILSTSLTLQWLKWRGCEGHIMENEVREALKLVGLDKSPRINGLPYEVYLRLSHMFITLLATIYNNWMRQGSMPRHFTRAIVRFLCRDGISNFHPLMILT